MAGTSNIRWFFLLSILFASLSCVKEESQDQPVDGDQERFAEFDPVVRFGLDTYMGTGEPVTKTTYAGDDKTIVLDNVRYERINWNGTAETNPDKPAYQDVIQIISQTNFTPKNDKPSVSYKVVAIPDWTNPSGNNREDYADAEPFSGSNDDNFYWSRPAGSKNTDKHYFYAVYPTSESAVRPTTRVTFSLDTTDPDKAKHLAHVSASINKKEGTDPDEADAPCRQQKYLEVKNEGTIYEYLPDMKNAFLYAAAAMPGADAGYKKVPLRFKPLYSAVKIMVSAGDEGAKKYRLKRVDLRTDLHNNGSKDGRADLNPDQGTALGGSFSTYFKADATSGTTADFAKIDPSTDTNTSLSDTLKRLFIEIKPEHYKVLGDNVLKFTFLVLPIEQRVMTVEYTFEYLKGSELDPSDPEYLDPAVDANWADLSKIVEVHRYLSLQQKTTKADNTGTHNEFSDNNWFPLPPATKLYVKSNVPEIQYFFDVVVQGNFPRTWKAGSTKPEPKTGESFATKDFYEAKDFYSVISYRDSAGVLQPMRWKVTGYRENSPSGSFFSTPPSWLHLRGDGPWKKVVPFDVDDPKHPGYPYTGTSSDFDPWDVPQGKGTTTFDISTAVEKDGIVIGYRKLFDRPSYTYTYYDAGAPDNDPRRPGRGWVNHGSYIHSTPDGEFKHHENDGVAFPDSTAWLGQKDKGEAYAYDLSSHDIYGKLTAAFNGDPNTATTANCYVVSAPGWYRFPAVYGNALKNGSPNSGAYTGFGDGSGDDGLLRGFLNHEAEEITSPWIPTIEFVDIVWDDANCMVSTRMDSGTRMDRKPFCKKIDGIQYIYFYVDDIAQGNALIAAKDDAGTIMWSWHIWAVTNPKQYLDTITLQANKTTLNPFDVTSPNLLSTTATVTSDMIKENDPKLNGVALSSYRDQRFWKTSDLGQHGDESVPVAPRYCDVEFSQYFKGKVVTKVVRRFFQSGVEDHSSESPGYQWGRKDPMRPGLVNLVPTPSLGVENTHVTIMEPETYYYSDNKVVPTGKRYDNLWNAGIKEKIENSYTDGRDGGSKDREVVKTIYDPSPVGFVMPNMLAFSGLNPYGPISQVKFPRAHCEEIAKEPLVTYPSRYVEFYTDYDASKTYLRKKDPDRTILFRLQGRINGTESATGGLHNENGAYYWTSEPALFGTGSFHGRSFTVDAASYYDTKNARYITNAWSVWPVAGVPEYNSQPKWQRTHGNRVRPMVEQP